MNSIIDRLKDKKRMEGTRSRGWRVGDIPSRRRLLDDLGDRVADATINYHGNPSELKANAARAAIGGAVALAVSHASPLLCGVAITYSAVKCYQSYRDHKAKGGF